MKQPISTMHEPQAFASPQDEIEALYEERVHLLNVNDKLNKKLNELREERENLQNSLKQHKGEGMDVHNAHAALDASIEALNEVKNGLNDIAMSAPMHLSLQVKLHGKVQELEFLINTLTEEVLIPTNGICMLF